MGQSAAKKHILQKGLYKGEREKNLKEDVRPEPGLQYQLLWRLRQETSMLYRVEATVTAVFVRDFLD